LTEASAPEAWLPRLAIWELGTTFWMLNKHCEMVVEDNGVGFDPPASVSGHGLGYMSELAN
jgi:glucose-6-phosphate-specific signal transduction histidine kinase